MRKQDEPLEQLQPPLFYFVSLAVTSHSPPHSPPHSHSSLPCFLSRRLVFDTINVTYTRTFEILMISMSLRCDSNLRLRSVANSNSNSK